MKAPDYIPTLTCDNIVVAPRGIVETQAGKIITLVPTSEIDYLNLKFGRPAQHPILSISVGAFVSLVGLYGLRGLMVAPQESRYELAMIVLGAVGGFMVFEALKKRYFLEVAEKKGSARLVFSRRARLEEIQDFCREVRKIYKYEIVNEV